MSTNTVLYDLPGPKARRRARIATVVVLLALAVVIYFAVRRLADRGQFEADLWSPVFNPGDENFPLVWDLQIGRAHV